MGAGCLKGTGTASVKEPGPTPAERRAIVEEQERRRGLGGHSSHSVTSGRDHGESFVTRSVPSRTPSIENSAPNREVVAEHPDLHFAKPVRLPSREPSPADHRGLHTQRRHTVGASRTPSPEADDGGRHTQRRHTVGASRTPSPDDATRGRGEHRLDSLSFRNRGLSREAASRTPSRTPSPEHGQPGAQAHPLDSLSRRRTRNNSSSHTPTQGHSRTPSVEGPPGRTASRERRFSRMGSSENDVRPALKSSATSRNPSASSSASARVTSQHGSTPGRHSADDGYAPPSPPPSY
jgi:hypothetical protein